MSIIKETSRNLRKNQTKTEKILWEYLRNRKFENKKFNRQYPIFVEIDEKEHFFVADFYCAEYKLVIELDGSVHDNTKERDKLRDFLISLKGITILRFTNDQVENNIDFIFESIRNVLIQSENKL